MNDDDDDDDECNEITIQQCKTSAASGTHSVALQINFTTKLFINVHWNNTNEIKKKKNNKF